MYFMIAYFETRIVILKSYIFIICNHIRTYLEKKEKILFYYISFFLNHQLADIYTRHKVYLIQFVIKIISTYIYQISRLKIYIKNK